MERTSNRWLVKRRREGCSDRALWGAGSDPEGAGTVGAASAQRRCELVGTVPGGALQPEALLELGTFPLAIGEAALAQSQASAPAPPGNADLGSVFMLEHLRLYGASRFLCLSSHFKSE